MTNVMKDEASCLQVSDGLETSQAIMICMSNTQKYNKQDPLHTKCLHRGRVL